MSSSKLRLDSDIGNTGHENCRIQSGVSSGTETRQCHHTMSFRRAGEIFSRHMHREGRRRVKLNEASPLRCGEAEHRHEHARERLVSPGNTVRWLAVLSSRWNEPFVAHRTCVPQPQVIWGISNVTHRFCHSAPATTFAIFSNKI